MANYRRFPFVRLFQSVVAEAPHLRAASSAARERTANSRKTIVHDASTRTGRCRGGRFAAARLSVVSRHCLFVCLFRRLDPRRIVRFRTSNIDFQVDALGVKRVAEERQNAGEGGRFPGGTEKRELEPAEWPSALSTPAAESARAAARGSARKTTAPRCAATVPGWAAAVPGRGMPDPASSRR